MKKLITESITTNLETDIYKIPVIWKTKTIMSVPAKSLTEAFHIIINEIYNFPEGEFVEGSYQIDYNQLGK